MDRETLLIDGQKLNEMIVSASGVPVFTAFTPYLEYEAIQKKSLL